MSHVLAALLILVIWGLTLVVKPTRKCRRCSNTGRGKKRSICGRCKGTGKQFRLGAKNIHRGVLALRIYLREKREEA